MARRYRELRTNLTVGDYSFDIVITRDILARTLAKHKGVWEFISGHQDGGELDPTKMTAEDIASSLNFYDALDDFISDILPEMVSEAERNGKEMLGISTEEFLDYCYENEVLEDVELQVFNFAMLGFTNGKGNSTDSPKVTVKMS